MSFFTTFSMLSKGMVTSCEIFFLTLFFSLPLGLFVALGRISKDSVLRNAMKIYISIMRGTPLMLQLLVVYFGPYYGFGIKISSSYRFTAVIIAFSINYAAYFAEIYRSGIEAIPVGQHEAAEVLGYSRIQCFLRIILPQVIKNILPPVTNEIITLIKDTSLAFSIAVAEMFTVAKSIAGSHKTMMPYLIAGVTYYIFNYIVAFVMQKVEERLNYYHV